MNFYNIYLILNVILHFLNNNDCKIKLKSNYLLFNNINVNIIDSSLLVNPNKNSYKNIKPEKFYDNINDKKIVQRISNELKDLKGIYGFLCKVNQKIYIGSSTNLVNRFKEHIKGRKSNVILQKNIKLYGLNNFYFIIFKSYSMDYQVSLIDFENKYISYFKPMNLYNLKLIASSMLGYKHTIEARQKMIDRFKNFRHPMLGKNHSEEAKNKIKLATKGCRNPMYGRKHKEISKELISSALSKPVYFYKLIEGKHILSHVYRNSVVVANLLGLHKTTIGRYIKKGKIIV